MYLLQKTRLLAAILLLASLAGCAPKTANPAAVGFNAAASDPQAVAIADQVMNAMGGRKAWDATRRISWNFFGTRTLVWDKQAGLCRIEWLKKPRKVIVNLNDGTGKVYLNDLQQTHPDTLAKYLDMGKKVWINDAYWLVMPFKLKDSGVTLKYVGTGKTESGDVADILQLTFAGVGVTPDNKYHVWVDKKTRLVTQWAFFGKYSDEKPQFTNAWTQYARYGNILLSSGRGKDEVSLAPITVSDALPTDGTFDK